ncbi:MAG TPA: NFACT RNA binding domain-containing protein [Candidatus Gastranaerophilales bacterium]|nr:NFACT RNA binding domain-containing protein [Candidatus Gastranaerophilales bacterium]
MINFDSLSLKALINELKPILTEGRVHKVQQPSRNELLLTIRACGKNQKLYICDNPKYPHIAVLSKEGEELRSIEIPQIPPMFCMLLRKHMEGSKINDIKQPGFNRILEIAFESYSELGDKVPMVLSCEFMGKYSNIILYNYETNVIIGCAHTVSSEKSREREVAGGLPYIYPPKQNKMDINKLSEQEFLNLVRIIPVPVNVWLNEHFAYMSKAIATEICEICDIETRENKVSALSVEKVTCLYEITKKTINLENLNPSLSKDMKLYSPIGLSKMHNWEKTDSVNSMLDRYFGYQVFKDKFTGLKNSLLNIAKKEFKKKKKIHEKHCQTAYSDQKPENYKQIADLIMANLYKIQQGSGLANLENIYDNNRMMQIPLDPSLSAAGNAQKYYKLYNKGKVAAKHSEELLKEIDNEIKYLEALEESINQAETLQDLAQIKQEFIDQGLINQREIKSKKKALESIQPAEFISSDGFIIYAGKNNRQNEYILKNSSPEDLWLHVQNIPGSHVIIKTQKDKEIPETTLHEAVYIAGWHSQAKTSSNAPVVYTKRKFVKKPSGAKPGFVIYAHEKTLWVNPDEDKVKSLRKK